MCYEVWNRTTQAERSFLGIFFLLFYMKVVCLAVMSALQIGHSRRGLAHEEQVARCPQGTRVTFTVLSIQSLHMSWSFRI